MTKKQTNALRDFALWCKQANAIERDDAEEVGIIEIETTNELTNIAASALAIGDPNAPAMGAVAYLLQQCGIAPSRVMTAPESEIDSVPGGILVKTLRATVRRSPDVLDVLNA